MRFTKGNKFAPGGKRPGAGRKPSVVKKLETELFDDKLVEQAVKRLKQLVKSGSFDACKFIVERRFGKARTPVDIGGSNVQSLISTAKAELVAEAARSHSQGSVPCSSSPPTPPPPPPTPPKTPPPAKPRPSRSTSSSSSPRSARGKPSKPG